MSKNYNSTLQSNNTDLQAILNIINELPEAVEQVAPVISVNNSNGLITATAGTKTSTHQLAFQAAKTITPTTASQIAVSSGYYTGGNITVAAIQTQSKTVTPTSTTQNITPDSGKFLSKVTVNGDSDLVAGNIKSGVNIFGITGTYVGSGGSSGNTSVEDGLVTRYISGTYTNDRVTSIGSYAFQACTSLTTVNFPVATTIGVYTFNWCSSLTTASFPAATSIGSYAFYNCRSLTTASFPAATYIGNYAFNGCRSLTTVSFPVATSIGSYAFLGCFNLKSLYLTGSKICKLSHSNTFDSTPIGGYSASAGTYGSIYVPASMLAAYQTTTNWTYFSSRFVGI